MPTTTIDKGWDAAFLAAQAGLGADWGAAPTDDGSAQTFAFPTARYDQTHAAIDGYPAAWLAKMKSDKLGAIQAAKDRALGEMAYAVGGQTYTITLTVQDQLDVMMKIQLLQAQGAGATTDWEIVNNVFLTWGAADLLALEGAGVAHVDAVYANTKALVAEVAAAADLAGVAAVDETAGWPA